MLPAQCRGSAVFPGIVLGPSLGVGAEARKISRARSRQLQALELHLTIRLNERNHDEGNDPCGRTHRRLALGQYLAGIPPRMGILACVAACGPPERQESVVLQAEVGTHD